MPRSAERSYGPKKSASTQSKPAISVAFSIPARVLIIGTRIGVNTAIRLEEISPLIKATQCRSARASRRIEARFANSANSSALSTTGTSNPCAPYVQKPMGRAGSAGYATNGMTPWRSIAMKDVAAAPISRSMFEIEGSSCICSGKGLGNFGRSD